jgi:predicted ATPase/signal transduction histidine kinase/tRNA A-37 threonylcarbamoyl transferase component Bud32
VTTSQAYALRERLQEGQRTSLYRAERLADGRVVVLKVLNPEHTHPQDVDRLRNEYELGRTLNGLAVVEPRAFTSYQGLPALELEDFHGSSLDRLAREPMPLGVFLPLGVKVAKAVADIHGRGLIHKDLKPNNILFDPATDEIKIADFCTASRIAREQTSTRPAQLIEGSLPYVSPEQTGRMNRAVDSRSDLYSLGVTFYQLVTGRLPFEANDAIGWVHSHVARTPIPPEALRPALPGVVSDIVLRLLAKAPDERYQSAAGLAFDLERCLAQWRETGVIARFPLGERDVSDRFLVPQKLYGRTAESAVLRGAFERVVASGAPELLLVAGYSGIGKSSLVHELHRPIVAKRGLFVEGKFEQHKRDIPYFTIIQAFREVMLDILAGSADSVADWRGRIQAALGHNAQLVVDLVPQVELVIGTQPPVAELSLGEAENRLRMVLRQFVGAFATQEHPLTIFLDDLQWADPASLALLVDLVAHSSTGHLLVIGAYRDNEVGPGHPLMRALDEARTEGAAIQALVLGPLPETHVSELVAETVHRSPQEGAPLALLVYERTGGNPFFVIQFLNTLHRQGLITFDRDTCRWRWDLARIRAQGYAENVIELMAGKLHDLPAETQHALKLAACLGASVDPDTLRLVFGRSPDAALRAAFEEDLLLRTNGAYRFPHDRVQEAAYALIPESERGATHLGIGRLLLEHTPPAHVEDDIFDIVNHLDQGSALVTSDDERERIAELNLMAGRRAQRSAAYVSALSYFTAGAALLPEGGWGRRHELSFAIELHRAECELATGALEAAERRLAALTRHATNMIDAAAVACLQVNLYTTAGQPPRAVDACLAYLRRAGIDWPPHPTNEEMRAEFARMWQRLASRAIEDLIDLPAMTDARQRATVDVLMIATAPTWYTDPNLCALTVARAVNLSLEQGNADGSSQAYVLLGEMLGPFFDDYRSAFRFGKLGFDLMEKRGPLRFKALVYLCFAIMVNHWTKHVRSSIDLERRAAEAAEQTGDLQIACYSRNDVVKLLLAAGAPLATAERNAEQALAFVRKAKFGLVVDTLVTKLRFIQLLRGVTPRFSSFDGDDFNEHDFELRLEATPSLTIAAGWYWIRKLQGRFFALDYGAALEAAAKAEALLWTAPSFPEAAEYHFFAGLAHAAAHDAARVEARPEHLQALAKHQRQMQLWAQHCPENFEHRAALMAAESARLHDDLIAAERLYEDAIRSARDNGFVHNEAVAYETAARFYRGRGFALIADGYLREARNRYVRWGAEGKVRDLDRRHPQLVEPKPSGAATTIAVPAEQLDLLSVVKASQTISGVMVQQELLPTLLNLVLEEGGARRAVVLFARNGRLEVAAAVSSDQAPPRSPAAARADLPDSLIGYVQRTHERVLLDDAAAGAGRFSGDAYLARARPRSVLCMPIRRQAEVVAFLYLENDLVPGAFTPERLLALELLAAQAAISLENAHLLERERCGRVEAQAAERRALLLSEATAVVTATLDYEGAFGAVTRLCVQSFADWAIIDLVEAGSSVRLAGAHREPDKEPLLRELAEHYPAGPDSHVPAAIVLASGKPLLLANISDEDRRGYAVDDHHSELIERLGTRSAIVVPLVARDTTLGALTLSSATAGRFGPADLELATEIGRRAALAVDNARLLRATQQAVRLRDDFLSVASHELRTPITSLTLSVDRLLRSEATGTPLPPEALSTSLHRVQHSTHRLQRLTNELLDVARIEHGHLDLDPAPAELGALARESTDELRFDLASAGCQVKIDADQPVAGVWDASRLQQVITNLLSNALKFGARRPIEIRVTGTGEVAKLAVRDHGLGIEPGRQAFIFDRFERAVPTVHYGGLGLGLYIARRIVQAHGGDLRVESEPGHGATFTLTLPLVIPPQVNGETREPTSSGREPHEVGRGRDP